MLVLVGGLKKESSGWGEVGVAKCHQYWEFLERKKKRKKQLWGESRSCKMSQILRILRPYWLYTAYIIHRKMSPISRVIRPYWSYMAYVAHCKISPILRIIGPYWSYIAYIVYCKMSKIENFKTLLIIHQICNGRRRYFLQSKIFHVKKMQKKEKKMVIRESSAEIVKKSEFLRLTQNF